MKFSPCPNQGGSTSFPTARLDGICQGLHEQRSGSQSHREKIAEHPHPRSWPLRSPLCWGLAASSAGTAVAVLQRGLRQFTRSCWAPSPAPSSSPRPCKRSGADTLCPYGLFIKPHFQTHVSAGVGLLHKTNYSSQAARQEGAAPKRNGPGPVTTWPWAAIGRAPHLTMQSEQGKNICFSLMLIVSMLKI